MDLFEIAEAMKGPEPKIRLRQGVITSLHANGDLQVQIAGSSTVISNVKALASLCPKIGAGVWLATDGLDLFALGTIAPVGAAYCALRRPSAQSIADITDTALNFTASATVEADTHGMFSTSSPSQLTCRVPGVYLLTASVRWASGAVGIRSLWLEVGGLALARQVIAGYAGTTYEAVSTTAVLALNAPVAAWVRQNQGSALNLEADPNSLRLTATWLRPPT